MDSLINLSDQYRAESKYDSAISVMFKLKKIAEESDDPEYLSRALIEISTTYMATKKYQFALEAARESKKYAQMANIKSLEMIALYNIGVIKMDNAQIDSALVYYKQVETYQREQKDSVSLGITLSGLSMAYYRLKKYDSAISWSKESAALYEAVGNYNYLAKRSFWIGEFYLIQESFDTTGKRRDLLDSAEKYFYSSYVISDSLNYPDPGFRSLRGLSVTYERKGELAEALKYLYKSHDITQQLYSADVENKLLELRERYNTANLELEAEQAKNEALKIERNRNILIIIIIAVIIFFVISLYVLEQRRKSLKAIAQKNDELNKQRIDELLQQQEISSLQGVLEGQEKERKRVAIDLHDRLGGILSMVKLHFSAVEEKLSDDNPEKKKFLTASELLDLAAGEVRNISHDLLSGVLAKFGLIPALKDLTSRINESGEIKLKLIYKGGEDALSAEQELQIYRITQEMVSNILKHSIAKEAIIQLLKNENDDSVNLLVEDDGQGFDPEANKSDGIGLSNLKARVEKLKGELHIDSGKGVGTSISIDIPIEND